MGLMGVSGMQRYVVHVALGICLISKHLTATVRRLDMLSASGHWNHIIIFGGQQHYLNCASFLLSKLLHLIVDMK